MDVPNSERYNLVILPLTSPSKPGALPQQFELSAGRVDREEARMVSPAWTAEKIRSTLQTAGLPPWHVEQLFQGNRMTFGGRDTRGLTFTQQELLAMGLAPSVEREENSKA